MSEEIKIDINSKDVKRMMFDYLVQPCYHIGGKYLVQPEGKHIEPNILYGLYFRERNIIFSIRRFNNCGHIGDETKAAERYHVFVYCYDINANRMERHVFYRSTTEGFWRYCICDEESHYVKGYNYVSTTFINMELQCFIFKMQKQYNIKFMDHNICSSACANFDIIHEDTPRFYKRIQEYNFDITKTNIPFYIFDLYTHLPYQHRAKEGTE